MHRVRETEERERKVRQNQNHITEEYGTRAGRGRSAIVDGVTWHAVIGRCDRRRGLSQCDGVGGVQSAPEHQ